MISIFEVFVPRCHWSSSSSEGSCQQIHPFHNPQVFDESWIHQFHLMCVCFWRRILRNVYGWNLQTKNGGEVIPNVSSAKRSSKRDATDMAVASCQRVSWNGASKTWSQSKAVVLWAKKMEHSEHIKIYWVGIPWVESKTWISVNETIQFH